MDLEPLAVRASDQERDVAVTRLQAAFAEGRLDDAEFDGRMRLALAAKTRADLAELFTDLPAAPAGGPVSTGPVTSPGRFQVAYKSAVRRVGRWRVPERYATYIYKGQALLDLRAAELEARVTTVRAVAYKSAIEIVVPPGVRVELSGFGVSSEVYGDQSATADVIVVHGLAYKGSIQVTTGLG
jgi:hypothetical protein